MAAASAILRASLINFEVFSAGNRYLGISDVELNSLKNKTNTISGSGILGEIDFPVLSFTESIEVGLNWRSVSSEFMQFAEQRAIDLQLFGAVEIYNHGAGNKGVSQVKINVRGLSKETTFGNFKPAEVMESKNNFEALFLQITVDNVECLNIDKLNYVYRVDGVDYANEIRRALNI